MSMCFSKASWAHIWGFWKMIGLLGLIAVKRWRRGRSGVWSGGSLSSSVLLYHVFLLWNQPTMQGLKLQTVRQNKPLIL